MKNLGQGSSAFVGAAIVALAAAYLAHTVFGIPRYAIRDDALGMAACLVAFIGAGVFVQRRRPAKSKKRTPKRLRHPTNPSQPDPPSTSMECAPSTTHG